VPRVDAGILRLERRREPLIAPARQAAYRRLVQAGFTGVGGSVQASLRRTYPPDKVASACASAGLDRRTIVAFVSPDQWIQIFNALDTGPHRRSAASARGKSSASGGPSPKRRPSAGTATPGPGTRAG
jgi:23S rRNA (adenine-N6)-dimethyltransferase